LSARTVIEKAVGGNGGDQIVGNSAANVIVGRGGNDRMTGIGTGDRFVFGPHSGHAVITDFVAGPPANDAIALSHTLLGSFIAVLHHAHNTAGHVVITVDAQDSIALYSVHSKWDLSPADFLFT